MRVLMLSHSLNYWTALYARPFIARGDAMLVLSFSPEVMDGVEMEYIGIDPWDQNKHAYITKVPYIRRRIRAFQADVVLASYLASNGLAATLAWRGPTVVSAHGGDVLEQEHRSGVRKFLRRALVRYVCKHSAVIHTVSHEMDAQLSQMGVPASKLVRIPVGVDASLYTPAADMPRAEATRLICTRKHEPIYDIPTIIDALGMLKAKGRRFECTFVGGGYLLDEHKAMASRLGLTSCVSFTGNVRAEQIPELLREADVYISSSLSDGTSSALLEAMAAGLLPVVTRIPANEPWLEHGRTGLFFEKRSSDELAAMLTRALEDPSLRRGAFEANRHRVEAEGDIHANMGRFVEVVDGVVAGSRRG